MRNCRDEHAVNADGKKTIVDAIQSDPLRSDGVIDLQRLAHDLRTPLAAIQSTAEALAGGHLGALDPRHAAYLASIGDTARHALAVLDEAMHPGDASCGPAGEVLQIRDLAGEVISALEALAAAEGVRLEVANGAVDARACARATEVRQMLINLVSNGITHAGRGSTVSLAWGAGSRAEVWIEVADDGPGIPAEVLARLRDGVPTDGKIAGDQRRRLGLVLTRDSARACGGRLELVTGRLGTRAKIVLPAAADV
jgi:signal transduction histidine kinase